VFSLHVEPAARTVSSTIECISTTGIRLCTSYCFPHYRQPHF